MKFIENDSEKEIINCHLTHEELRIFMSVIGAIFSEVPVFDFEFETRLGCTKKDLNDLADKIWEIIDQNNIEL